MRTSNRSVCRHCSRKCRRNHLEPPCTDPYARWCGRGRRATAAPMPITGFLEAHISARGTRGPVTGPRLLGFKYALAPGPIAALDFGFGPSYGTFGATTTGRMPRLPRLDLGSI